MKVDIAGEVAAPPFYAAPDDLKALALLLVAQCVAGLDVGGFATKNFQFLYNYAVNPAMSFYAHLGNPTPRINFFTVTVSSNRFHLPGNSDPAIPLTIVKGLDTERAATYPNDKDFYDFSIRSWTARAERMSRGGVRTWFDPAAASDDMSYECDAGLGSPATVDCAQIEWNQLGSSSSDTLTVGPGTTTFLHQNTCYLAISATVSLTLTWTQIRTAVTTLMNVCVQNPFQPVQGGRAYYHQNPPIPASSKQRRRKTRDDTSGMTGLNALPPGANITMFEQKEKWTDSAAELKSCTWSAVLKGIAVSTCHV